MKTVEALIKARDVIADPQHWCIGLQGEDAEGNFVWPTSPHAVRWCALGALRCASDSYCGAEVLAEVAGMPQGLGNVADYNNAHTHAEVLDWFDRAIASCIEPEVTAVLDRAREPVAERTAELV